MKGFEFLPALSATGRNHIEDVIRHGTEGRVILRVMQLPSNSRVPNQGHVIKVGYHAVDDGKTRQVWLQVSRVFSMDGGAHAEIERRLDGMTKFFEANGVKADIQRSFNPSLRPIPPTEPKPVMYKGSQALKEWADLHGETQSDFDNVPEPRE